ncbi:CubicO group peptidase (beta-lactamase class C family) [Rhodococcus sp. AG1013]|uniref:serine hydrolase domain-containing protein n=1 Tax=Rhodococcus sp. AG1013 TaxID=2183996 RepID=UPI000E2C229C|nr:serine hydrolase domain-containing protein [Rhodococcus sp. AG1013]RDI16147.1 CubicO group peptidase (beta-lactamase class C family) [Rhodococcus sp. AG1013]
MKNCDRAGTAGPVSGVAAPAFTAVAEEFERNFADRGEVGASLCVLVDGTPVVDLWGGVADPDTGRRWESDTVGVVFSCTKAAVALCIHLLEQAGELRQDMPVAQVWPQFAANGKSDITIGMLLDHSAGIPVLSASLRPNALEDWEYMVGHIAAQDPFWCPGDQHGYHPVTFGHVLGEVVRRVTGSSVGGFFASEIARPYGLDFWIGLPEEIEPRVAPIADGIAGESTATPFLEAALRQRGSIPNLFLFNSGNWARTGVNTRAGRAAEIPAANGVTNGRGLAQLYARILRNRTLAAALSGRESARVPGASASDGFDATLLMPTRFRGGFMLSMGDGAQFGDGHSMRIGHHAFGHCGSGGSIGFADPEFGLTVGYTMNKLGPGPLLNQRGQVLVDAIYRSLGQVVPPRARVRSRPQFEQEQQ